uniref:Uncharacterized protein n=1 Tax=Hippocampus comes TaxID=109280 RepID=A0A3Q2YJD3_HIPCM
RSPVEAWEGAEVLSYRAARGDLKGGREAKCVKKDNGSEEAAVFGRTHGRSVGGSGRHRRTGLIGARGCRRRGHHAGRCRRGHGHLRHT